MVRAGLFWFLLRHCWVVSRVGSRWVRKTRTVRVGDVIFMEGLAGRHVAVSLFQLFVCKSTYLLITAGLSIFPHAILHVP